MASGVQSRLDSARRTLAANRVEINETRREYYARTKKHYNAMKRARRVLKSDGCSTVCEMLEKHHSETQDDPESLTTDFMQHMLGRDCHTD